MYQAPNPFANDPNRNPNNPNPGGPEWPSGPATPEPEIHNPNDVPDRIPDDESREFPDPNRFPNEGPETEDMPGRSGPPYGKPNYQEPL